ncbi:LysR family transcriptional regulator [Burkholderia lata]|nr:LysR family transcriptional regulator [Burkholderia lata]
MLVAVIDAGSMSAAARQPGIPLATVSRKIADLEACLNTRLLHRMTRQLSLTEAGESYVAGCRRILDDIAIHRILRAGFHRAAGGRQRRG